jgi:4-amino-4-deoxy-L-arabinose transferase-like glycosyltransferase
VAPGLVLAIAAGAISLSRGFDGLYGQDAYAYFDYSIGSVRQSILQLQPLDAFFWPPGYPVLVALTSMVVGPTALAGQLVSLLAGALVPILTVLLVRELWPEDWQRAVLAGAIVAVCGQLWQSSVVVMSDTTGLALATFSAFALARYANAGRGLWLVAAGAAIAYATLSRWIYGIVALPFAAHAVWTLWARRRLPPEAFVSAAVALLILVPIVGPPLLGLLNHPGEPAPFAGNFQVYSWSPLNALRRDFFTADGHLQYALPNGVYYAIAPFNLAFFGPLLAIWVLVGLWAARGWSRRTALLIIGWAVCVYAFHAGAPWQNFRFALAYLPPLAILAAAGLLLAWRNAKHPLRLLVPACAAAGLLIAFIAAGRLVERFIDTKDQELALVHWTTAQTPPDAQLLTFGPTLAFRHYSGVPTFDLFDLSPTEVDALVQRRGQLYVLVDQDSLQSQWLEQAPWTNFLRVRDGPGLTPLGGVQGYTFFRVNTGGS